MTISNAPTFDWASNFHPYECDGPGKCVHCDRSRSDRHDPSTCALCDPAYDMQPNRYWPEDGA